MTAFTKDPNKRRDIDHQVELIIEAFIRDYYKSYFDGLTVDEIVKDLFRETSGAEPTAVIEGCEVI